MSTDLFAVLVIVVYFSGVFVLVIETVRRNRSIVECIVGPVLWPLFIVVIVVIGVAALTRMIFGRA